MRRLALALALLLPNAGCKVGGSEDHSGTVASKGRRDANTRSSDLDEGEIEEPEIEDPASGILNPAPAAPKVSGTMPLCTFRAVGYGFTMSGGTAGMRRSASFCLIERTPSVLVVRSETAGTCSGDSGGPLYQDGSNTLVGTLSGSNSRNGDCGARFRSFFTETASVRAFIDEALATEPLAP